MNAYVVVAGANCRDVIIDEAEPKDLVFAVQSRFFTKAQNDDYVTIAVPRRFMQREPLVV